MSKTARLGPFALAFALTLPIAACDTASEPPKVIDTTTPAKLPAAPTATPVTPVAAPTK